MLPTLFEQGIAFTAGFVIKPLYSILSLLLVLRLWRQTEPGLTLIRRSMIAFFVGEMSCAVGFYAPRAAYDTTELIHVAGMVVFAALLPWGFMVLLDDRVVKFHAPEGRCILMRFCGRCQKRAPVPCGLIRVGLFAAPALGLLALMPLSTPLRPLEVSLPIFGVEVAYSRSAVVQLVELRLFPIAAALLFLLTTFWLAGPRRWLGRANWSFFSGLGFLLVSLFMCVILVAYREMPIWADWWEELTELLAVGGTAFTLFSFRGPLGLARDPERPAEASG